jgi:hypothetical protein
MLARNPKGKIPLYNARRDKNNLITLRKVWIGYIKLTTMSCGGRYEYGVYYLGSIQGGKFLDQLSD